MKKLSVASLSALIALPAFATQASANSVAPNEDRLLETLEKKVSLNQLKHLNRKTRKSESIWMVRVSNIIKIHTE